MKGVGVKGLKVTLKVKKRKPNAPPPPKFLGHGSCFNLSKSLDAPQFTRDALVLSTVATKLFESLDVPKDDVRGMGMVVSNLRTDETESFDGNRNIEKFFQKKCSTEDSKIDATKCRNHEVVAVSEGKPRTIGRASKSGTVKAQSYDPCPQDQQDDLSVEVVEMKPGDEWDVALPAFSQIHMSQVDALPSPLRRQIKSKIERENNRSRKLLAHHGYAFSAGASEAGGLRDPHTTETFSNDENTKSPPSNFSHTPYEDLSLAAADSRHFFLENILPLSKYLDENPPCTFSIEKVVAFFGELTKDSRYFDAIRLLRSIQHRRDTWSSKPTFELVLNAINSKLVVAMGASISL